MKRPWVIAGVAALAGVAFAARVRRGQAGGAQPRAGAAAPPRAGVPTPREIAPGVHLIGPWGRTQTNVYLIGGGESWMLVDAGWASDGPRIAAAVRDVLGPALVPSAILLTHAHPDHAGSARELAEAWGCPVLAEAAELPIATGDFAAMVRDAGPLDHWLILPIMRAIGARRREEAIARSSLAGVIGPLPPGGEIPGLEAWSWIPAPGHTRGHVAYVRAGDRVVLSGDALLTLDVNSVPGILRQRQGLAGPPWYTTWDGAAAAATIGDLARLEPAVLGSGHGFPLSGPGTAAAVRAFAVRTGAQRRGMRSSS